MNLLKSEENYGRDSILEVPLVVNSSVGDNMAD